MVKIVGIPTEDEAVKLYNDWKQERKYESSIQVAKVGNCKLPLSDLAADVGHFSFY